MPKKSKVNVSGSRSKQAVAQEVRNEFFCCRCERRYIRQKGNFPASQSSLYLGNGKYLPVCNRCIDELYEHYKTAFGNESDAIRRVCSKFDIYWHPELYSMLQSASTSQSRMRAYISKTNLYKYVGKTYDDTLDEERFSKIEREKALREAIQKDNQDLFVDEGEEIKVSEQVVQYWGTGFTPEMYIELENRRSYWISQYPEGISLDPGEEAILRQICNLEISINQDRVAGKPIEKSVNALNTLLGSMNMKPSQKKEVEENYIPFGVEIARWEEDCPIPEPDNDFKDVDRLRHNVIAWFLGSLCRTTNTDNEYSQYFDEEIKKYTVERPLHDDDDYGEDIEDDGGE